MSLIQINLQNVTPQERRFFILTRKFPTDEVQSILSGAWESFQLSTGSSGFAAYASTFQLVARSLLPSGQHQRVLADTEGGKSWVFKGGHQEPSLSPATEKPPENEILCLNSGDGAASVSIYNNFSQILGPLVLYPQSQGNFQPGTQLFFYASVPVTDEQQPVVLESEIGEVAIGGSNINAQLLQEGSTLSWKFTTS